MNSGKRQNRRWILSTRRISCSGLARLNEGVRYIAVPKVRKDISTSRVLVMEHIDGYGIDEYESLAAEGYDRREIAAKLADNYMKQIIHDGFFHADPHVGNLRIRDGKIVWLDFGMMGQLNDRDRELIRRAFSAMARNDISELTEVILTLGIHDGTYDYNRLYDDMEKLMGAYMTKDLQEIDLGSAVQEIFTIAHRHTFPCRGASPCWQEGWSRRRARSRCWIRRPTSSRRRSTIWAMADWIRSSCRTASKTVTQHAGFAS